MTEWPGPLDETGKCGMIKIPPCLKALSAQHMPKFCSPSPAVVTSPYISEKFKMNAKQFLLMRIISLITMCKIPKSNQYQNTSRNYKSEK
jgi:hypothetical protein